MSYRQYASEERLAEMMQYQSFQRMSRNREPSTVSRYASNLKRVMRETGLNPDQIVQEAKSLDEVGIGDLKAKVIDGHTPGVRYLLTADFNRLMKSNGIKNLPDEKYGYRAMEDHPEYSKEDLRRLLEYVNFPKGKLIILIAAESGLRIHHILSLRWRHVSEDFAKNDIPDEEEFEKKWTPIFIRFTKEERMKAKSTGYAFLGKASIRLLWELVKSGEVTRSPNSFLFESSYQRREGDRPVDRRGKPLSYVTVYGMIRLAKDKAKLPEAVQPFHGIRSFFENQLVKANVNDAYRKRFMGHSLGSASSYVTRDVEELSKVYHDAYSYLDLGAEVIAPEALVSWQNEKVELERQLKESEKARDKMAERLDRIERFIARLETDFEIIPKSKGEKKEEKKESGDRPAGYVAKGGGWDDPDVRAMLEQPAEPKTGKK